MEYYLLKISYLGTHYCGWQTQPDNPVPSVQSSIQTVLESFVHKRKVQIYGASRTDSGVHANGQYIKVTLPKNISCENLIKGLNTNLPLDIKVISCQKTNKEFNFNDSVECKEYHYYFSDQKHALGSLSSQLYFHPNDLDISKMNECVKLIKGEHDFSAFHVAGSRTVNPKRLILECDLESIIWPHQTKAFCFKIKASGFLKYMVRMLCYAIIKVGEGELSLREFEDLLTGEKGSLKIKKAPAQGLYLQDINLSIHS